ncbi:MAG: 5-formyltetrahydrofolate cyclo-ligase [Actinomycetota bacterium]
MDGSFESDVSAAKRSLRERVLVGRAEVSAEDLALAGAMIAERLRGLPVVQSARIVAAYIGVGVEVPTGRLVDELLESGQTVLLPVLEADRSLTWRPLSDRSQLVPGRHGLLEPQGSDSARALSDAQVVVLPGLCYDRSGNRLGRGGGSYDRALKDLPRAVRTIGIALDCDIFDSVPVQLHDRPVQMIVTPTRVITTENGGN